MNLKTSIYTELHKALLENQKYKSKDSEPKLLRNSVIEDALKMDKELIQILLNNPKLKSKFFTEINDVLVFDKVKFTYVINNKEFLPDSYTRFKQKIGLIDSKGDFISDSNDVVLSFPYKDCVLEGGQTKEDQKKDEIFYNETLAPDEVDCLLAPKVFTNAKRYTKEGGTVITEFKDDDNLLVKGNNLLVLSCLLKRYEGKIKLIYIDPPYNTDNDSFRYNDSFNHSTWLTFMKNRLELAKKLLRMDGVICVQCDDNEQAYLKVLMDGIFGNDKFVNCVAVKSSETSGPKMSHVEKKLPKIKDYLLIYKNDDFKYNQVVTTKTAEEIKNYSKYYTKFIENFDSESDVTKWKIRDIKEYFKSNNLKSDEQSILKFKLDNAKRVIYRTGNKSLESADYDSSPNKCIRVNDKVCWEGKEMLFLSNHTTEKLCDMWMDLSTINQKIEGGVVLDNGKKTEMLLKRIIDLTTMPNDIVCDFFAGTNTTGCVAHKLKRKWISVEQLDYIYDLTLKRSLNVLKGDPTGISKDVNWQGGGSFVYCELKELNQEFVRKIHNSSSEELNDLYKTISESNFISTNVDPKVLFSNQTLEDFNQLSDIDKKNLLLKLLDLNMLYVNYSDIEDKNYEISDADKQFTRSFYGDSK